ncbi:LysR family transcriptional regulator [Leucobacter luti]|uniref:LysR family transcriptional regulator n=1 Tax=Leucobacter luti TaxID=340320 RepID=UPI003CFC3D81
MHLRTLVEVVTLGSFAAAANRLGYTASAVSQQMTSLEQHVGLPLFERTARSAHPTEAARAMVRASNSIFAGLEAVLEAARGAHEVTSSEVTVATYDTLARAVLRGVYEDPEIRGSGIRLRVEIHNPSIAVRTISSGDCPDIAFVYRFSGSGLAWPPAMRQLDFGRDRYRVVAPAAWELDAAGPPSAEVLSDIPWVLHHPGTSDAIAVDSAFRSAGIRARAMGHSDNFDVAMELAAAGAAAAFVPEIVTTGIPAGARVVDVPSLDLARDVHALVSPSAPGPATNAVLSAIRRAMPGPTRARPSVPAAEPEARPEPAH